LACPSGLFWGDMISADNVMITTKANDFYFIHLNNGSRVYVLIMLNGDLHCTPGRRIDRCPTNLTLNLKLKSGFSNNSNSNDHFMSIIHINSP